MQFKKNDARKQLLEQMSVPEETISFLEDQNVPFLFEWCYLCAVEGMTKETLERICSEAGQDKSTGSDTFKKERINHLRKSFENNIDLEKRFSELLKNVKDIYEKFSSLETEYRQSVQQSLREKEKDFGQIIEGKNETLREKDKRIAFLEKELADQKNEIKTREERILTLEDRLKSMEIRMESASIKGEEGSCEVAKEKKETGASASVAPILHDNYVMVRPRRRFFMWRGDRRAEQFIHQFMENGDYNDEQKDFLIRCLEQGDSIRFIQEYANPSLSVEQMAWLRKIAGRSIRYGR